MKNALRSKAFLLLLGVAIGGGFYTTGVGASRTANTSSTQAVARVRVILTRNQASCHIDQIKSVSATRGGNVWKVTARLVMSGSGRPLNETAKWNVRVADGGAVAADQLASEIENGCP
jgi:hypothetical protein